MSQPMPDQSFERPARLQTARLLLVVLLPSEIRALIEGNTARASDEAGVIFPPKWPESDDVREGLPWHLGYLESDQRQRAWRIRVVVERATNLVGAVNLKGPPDAEGEVEIGWGISETWRRRGYAREAVTEVMDWVVRQPGTKSLTATIADDNVASQELAAKLGFIRTTRSHRRKPVWDRPVT
jgi:ribosomal-protein-alanine N-acetyltransferase